jgi:hypothetical protein
MAQTDPSPPTSPPVRRSLARHVHCCATGQQLILLDARRGHYLGLGLREWTGLQALIGGLPPQTSAAASCDAATLQRLVKRLHGGGLLAEQLATAWSRPDVDEPVSSLNALDLMPAPEVSAGQVLRFVRAVAGAALALRCCSIESIARRVGRRQRRLGPLGTQHSPRSVLQAVAAYEWLRPLMLTARDRCLLDSLALVGFLASAGIASRWVIGVKTAPFGAHAWVQRAGVVLNDQHSRAKAFTPILVA